MTPLLIAAALLVANGFFVAAEFALLASRRSRLEHLAAEGHGAARSALAGVRELSLMLAGAQLGITMASLGLGAVAEPAVARWLVELFGMAGMPPALRHAVALVIALSIVVFLHMVVGEMAPKTWAIAGPERMALLLARPFRAFTTVTRPFIRLLNAAANGVVRLCGVQPIDERVIVHDPRDLLRLVAESGRRGRLAGDQQQLLQRALAVEDLDAEDVMVPRPDMVAVPATAGMDELERVTCATGRSRLPVFGVELDDVVGVVHAKDLLAVDQTDRDHVAAGTLAHPALVVPESRPAHGLMRQMRSEGERVALVVDEYGSVTGLVAMEDLLEELIGEFQDESDVATGLVWRRSDGSVIVPGQLRPDELTDQTGVELPQGEWETVAGLVLARLGHLPEVGERIELDSLLLVVERVEGNRVASVAISPRQ